MLEFVDIVDKFTFTVLTDTALPEENMLSITMLLPSLPTGYTLVIGRVVAVVVVVLLAVREEGVTIRLGVSPAAACLEDTATTGELLLGARVARENKYAPCK